jgi:hypothetical protein
VTVTRGVTQTPFLAGADPFERFPQAGQTSTGTPTDTPLGRGTRPPRGVIAALAAVTAALTPTASSQPSLAAIMRSLVERVQVTRANVHDVLPLLEFGSLPQQAVGPSTLTAAPRRNAAPALAAAADLSAWLGTTEEQVADIAGFSRRNYSNWRAGLGSYPKTVRGLFELHALVGGLVRTLGTDGAMAWIALPSTTGNPRRQLLATSAGRAQLLAEAQPLLFARVEQERPAAEFGDQNVDASPSAQRHATEALIRTPPRRRRRPA